MLNNANYTITDLNSDALLVWWAATAATTAQTFSLIFN